MCTIVVALPTYVWSAMLLRTMRNMHTWSPLVLASATKENRSVVLADYLMDAQVFRQDGIALSALRSAWKSKLSMPSPTPRYIGASIL